MKKQKGITLVALIITIIIMLILVAVSVNVIIKSNLIGTAEKTANGYKAAQDRESNGTITINGKEYGSVDDYIKGKVKLPEIEAGERASENSQYETAVIPKGFTVSNIEGEKTVAGGLVIYDIPEGTTVDWTKPDTVKTAYNQFVWIPVEVKEGDDETSVAAFARSAWTSSADGGQRTTGLSTAYTEPYSYDKTNNYDGDEKTGIASQIAELTKSIYKNGGFWIGRYEAGSTTERTSSNKPQNDLSSLVIQQDKYPYNYIEWGKGMGDVSTEGAVYLCNNLYNSANYGVKSMLCTGAAWDSMLDFIKDSTHSVKDSTTWGNYYESETYQITRGELSTDYGSTWTAASSSGTDVTKYSSILLTTGATERNSNKNLYDVAGNCEEWTTEAYGSVYRVLRGGSCGNSGSVGPASGRDIYIPTYSYSLSSFRPLLYIKELDVNA